MEKSIKINKNQLKNLIKESIQKVFKESSFEENNYNGRYDELIKDEMHNLLDLERQVPMWLKPEIHSMVVKMQSILSEIKTNKEMQTY